MFNLYQIYRIIHPSFFYNAYPIQDPKRPKNKQTNKQKRIRQAPEMLYKCLLTESYTISLTICFSLLHNNTIKKKNNKKTRSDMIVWLKLHVTPRPLPQFSDKSDLWNQLLFKECRIIFLSRYTSTLQDNWMLWCYYYNEHHDGGLISSV